MVFIIVVQFSLKNIKIGLRWEIKKASIVSSNLGILAPVLERNCSSIKVIFFFALLEFVRIGKISIRLFCFYGKDNINN